jgi:diguanylate cyclase (GGDEF)-like protein
MPNPDTLLAIIFLAVAANLIVGGAVLAAPRLRNRVHSNDPDLALAPPDRLARGGFTAGGRPEGRPAIGVFGPLPVPIADPGTGLDLAASWSRWLLEEDSRVRRYRHSATIVLIEIDGLERLIDRLGTDAAERLIPPVAATLRRYAREVDRIARLGDRTFGVLLPETDEVQAINFVERVRTTCDLWLASGAIALRLAMGWAEANPGRTIEVALGMAQDRLNVERRRHGRLADAADPADADDRETSGPPTRAGQTV